MVKFLSFCLLCFVFCMNMTAQKVLQIEKFGKAKTKKMYIGETIFIQTFQNPDWFEGVIEDLRPDANAIVFYDRIILIKDITAVKFRRKSSLNGMGKALQFSWIVPVAYQTIYGLVEPPVQLKEGAFIGGSALLLGSLMRLIPPKKLKFGEGKKRRLRVLDLTFYATPEFTNISPIW